MGKLQPPRQQSTKLRGRQLRRRGFLRNLVSWLLTLRQPAIQSGGRRPRITIGGPAELPPLAQTERRRPSGAKPGFSAGDSAFHDCWADVATAPHGTGRATCSYDRATWLCRRRLSPGSLLRPPIRSRLGLAVDSNRKRARRAQIQQGRSVLRC